MKLKCNILLIILINLIITSCNTECTEIMESFENGNKRFVRVYPECKNKSNFKRLIYYENGQLQNECHYINNEEHGQFKRWNRKGVLIEQWEVKDGKETGHIQCWFDNGNLKKEVIRVNGFENGKYIENFENGEISIKGNYKYGWKHGTWTIYDKHSGRIEYNYVNDTLNGKTYELSVDSVSTTHVHGQYLNGKEHGEWKWFNRDSILFQTAVYNDGKIENIKTD